MPRNLPFSRIASPDPRRPDPDRRPAQRPLPLAGLRPQGHSRPWSSCPSPARAIPTGAGSSRSTRTAPGCTISAGWGMSSTPCRSEGRRRRGPPGRLRSRRPRRWPSAPTARPSPSIERSGKILLVDAARGRRPRDPPARPRRRRAGRVAGLLPRRPDPGRRRPRAGPPLGHRRQAPARRPPARPPGLRLATGLRRPRAPGSPGPTTRPSRSGTSPRSGPNSPGSGSAGSAAERAFNIRRFVDRTAAPRPIDDTANVPPRRMSGPGPHLFRRICFCLN